MHGNTFSSVLKTIRKKRLLSVSELSRQCGLSKSHISMLENGKRNLGIKGLKKLATVLKLNPTEMSRLTWLAINGPSAPSRNTTKPNPPSDPCAPPSDPYTHQSRPLQERINSEEDFKEYDRQLKSQPIGKEERKALQDILASSRAFCSQQPPYGEQKPPE